MLLWEKMVDVIFNITYIVLTLPTHFNLAGIDMSYCVAIEGVIATYYIFTVEIFSIMWILFYSFKLYKNRRNKFKKDR